MADALRYFWLDPKGRAAVNFRDGWERTFGGARGVSSLFSFDRSADAWWPGNPTTATPAVVSFPADDLGRPVDE